jgi:hypothetical protein
MDDYSSLVNHMASNVVKDASIEPPIQAKSFLWGGATTLTVIPEGARERTVFSSRSSNRSNILRTTYKSRKDHTRCILSSKSYFN